MDEGKKLKIGGGEAPVNGNNEDQSGPQGPRRAVLSPGKKSDPPGPADDEWGLGYGGRRS